MRHHIHIVVPGLTPPSVNSYVRHTRKGEHFKTPEAKGFHDAVVLFARQAESKQGALADKIDYEVMIVVYYAHGERGDIDNKAKIPLDALVSAQVIRSDAKVTDCILRKRRDPNNPRTEIWVRAAEQEENPKW